LYKRLGSDQISRTSQGIRPTISTQLALEGGSRTAPSRYGGGTFVHAACRRCLLILSAVGAGDADASPSKNCWGEID